MIFPLKKDGAGEGISLAEGAKRSFEASTVRLS